jgi:tetratricopeptide (TPR) repeat protein
LPRRSFLVLRTLRAARLAPAAAAVPPRWVRKDPKGVKGISPFWESLKKGDDLYVARDFDGAIAAYREAIAKEPQNALGHYRMGEAQLAKADLQEAEASWVAALRFVGGDLALKAKILFVLADLRERQKSHDDAKERWTAGSWRRKSGVKIILRRRAIAKADRRLEEAARRLLAAQTHRAAPARAGKRRKRARK